MAGTPRAVNGVWSSWTVPTVPAGKARAAPTVRAAARSRSRAPHPSRDSRGMRRSRSATKSSRTSERSSPRGPPRRRASRARRTRGTACCRPWPPRRRRAGSAARGRRTGASARRRTRASSSTAAVPPGAVVGADEALEVLRVVVGGDGDRGRAPGDRADDVAQTAGHRLEAAVGQLAPQPAGEAPRLGDPAGRGPSATCRRSSANARRGRSGRSSVAWTPSRSPRRAPRRRRTRVGEQRGAEPREHGDPPLSHWR